MAMQKLGSIPEQKSQSWQISAARPTRRRRTRRPAILLGLAAIGIAVGGLGAWSAMAPLASAVVASGKVAVASKRKEIQHVDGGTVKAIHVQDGDIVKANSVLIELDDGKAKVRHALARAAYFSSVATRARLVAERDGADTIVFPDKLLAEAARSSEIRRRFMDQQRLFAGRRQELAGQIKISLQKIGQLKEEITGLTSQRASTIEQSDLAAKEQAVIEKMFTRGYVTRQRVHSIRREHVQLTGSLGQIDASIAKARKEIDETEFSIRQLTLKRQSDILAELQDIERRIFNLNEEYQASGDELARLAILAPVAGVVVNSRVHTIGGVIRPGETILEIVPGADALVVEARVRPLDIDEVAKGQPTEVRFSAFKQRTTPFLTGNVLQVSADSVTDQRTGEPYYCAIIVISRTEFERLGHRLQPGMPAEILIKTGSRTPLTYLVQPLMDSMHKALREQ
jgi:HlyD family type I secretion membrane fusion protein